ncbi:unnamed protein product [Boreogadus saida]
MLDIWRPVFLASSHDLTLVLEEDGTGVECEAFFQPLHRHKALMVLERGQMWTESKLRQCEIAQQSKTDQNNCICPTSQKAQGSGIANLTFDLFKLHRKEFLGCLSIRATLYEMYTFSYDLGYTRAKPAIKGSVRLLTHSSRLAGQLLLCGASSALSAVGKDDDYHYFDGGRYILCIH